MRHLQLIYLLSMSVIEQFNQKIQLNFKQDNIPSLEGVVKIDLNCTRLQEVLEYLLAQSKIYEVAISELITRSNKQDARATALEETTVHHSTEKNTHH